MLRKASIKQGFEQRELFCMGPGFDWSQFSNASENFSLFSEKTFLELRNPTAKFDDKAQKILFSYLENPPPDKVLLIITSKLTGAQQKTKWYKAVSKAGVTITIWPIKANELIAWVSNRMKKAMLNFNTDSAKLLAELTQGNLLAANQAVEKLRLLYPKQAITPKEITHVIHDNAKFTVFDLINYALAGQTQRYLRTLAQLKACGTEPTLILWALHRELRDLWKLAQQLISGIPLAQVMQSQWSNKKPLLQAALKRLPIIKISQLLQSCELADHKIKGMSKGNCWTSFEEIGLGFCDKNPAKAQI